MTDRPIAPARRPGVHTRERRARTALAALLVALGSAPTLATGGSAAKVDVQFSLCSPFARIEKGLALRSDGVPFDVWLFDDADLTLFAKGLRIRLRGAGRHAELTIKAARWDCSAVPDLPKDEGKCEYDLHGDEVAGALSLTRHIDEAVARDLVAGRRPLADLLSTAQQSLLQRIPSAWPLPVGLRALGPTRVRSYRDPSAGYAVDLSELPTGQSFIEISIKVPPGDVDRTRARMLDRLARNGVEACADQSAQAVNKLRLLRKD